MISIFELKEFFKSLDQTIFGCLVIILSTGLFALYSADNNQLNDFNAQIFHIMVGFLGLLIISKTPPKVIFFYTPFIYILGIFFLIWVKFMGYEVNGSQRWINLGFMKFQPSEIFKLILPLMLAWFYQNKERIITLKIHFMALIFLAIPFFLIKDQPDLGTALMLAFSALVIIFMAGLPSKFILWGFIISILSSPLIWKNLENYQQNRILSLIDPFKDALGSGYQTIQSLIALGSGGLIGKGWLNSSQTQLNFLPEATTDFIFAVYSEEFGFIGVIAILSIYIALLLRILFMISKMQDTFSRLASVGLLISLFAGVVINLGMIAGLLPIVGAPLPFFSYGGSSMVVSLLSLGIIMSLYNHKSLIAN
jgi:rod shape determining protein RodA